MFRIINKISEETSQALLLQHDIPKHYSVGFPCRTLHSGGFGGSEKGVEAAGTVRMCLKLPGSFSQTQEAHPSSH